MEKLGHQLLYFDTDSVIFVQKQGQRESPVGITLGDWDNQLQSATLTLSKESQRIFGE